MLTEAFPGCASQIESVSVPSSFPKRELPMFRVRTVSRAIAEKLCRWLDVSEVGSRSKTKTFRFPKVVTSSQETMQGFLDGYCDGDGHTHPDGSRRILSSNTAFLAELGLKEPAIHRVLSDCYALLGLVSFFTVGEDEVRAWPIPEGTRAQDAAGTVHSDIGRGFIRAEVNSYDELVAVDGSLPELRARGQLRLEGKDYLVRDGEICHFRFNVGR